MPKIIFSLILLFSITASAGNVVTMFSTSAPTTDYFGQTTDGTAWAAITTSADERYSINVLYTCPDAGSKTVVELSGYVRSAGGTAGNVRFAIYDNDATFTDSALVCQGTAEVLVDSASAGWVGHIGSSNIEDAAASTPCTLTGGTTYRLAMTADSTDVEYFYLDGSSGDTRFGATERTAGFPALISATTSNSTRIPYIRVGVQ